MTSVSGETALNFKEDFMSTVLHNYIVHRFSHNGGAPLSFFLTTLPPQLKNEAPSSEKQPPPPIENETPLHEMIPRKRKINSNLKSS